MNETRTASMLQRVPVILAVTAHSYGLSLQPAGPRQPGLSEGRQRRDGQPAGRPQAHR